MTKVMLILLGATVAALITTNLLDKAVVRHQDDAQNVVVCGTVVSVIPTHGNIEGSRVLFHAENGRLYPKKIEKSLSVIAGEHYNLTVSNGEVIDYSKTSSCDIRAAEL